MNPGAGRVEAMLRGGGREPVRRTPSLAVPRGWAPYFPCFFGGFGLAALIFFPAVPGGTHPQPQSVFFAIRITSFPAAFRPQVLQGPECRHKRFLGDVLRERLIFQNL